MRVATGRWLGAGTGEAAKYEPSPAGARRPVAAAYGFAGAVHVASLFGVVAFWAWLDRGLWFFGDEWDFLVDRGLAYPPGSPHSIWYPHNEHWSTLPVLAWRALFSIWHLSSYWPYLALLFAVQVVLVHLAWRACLRAGASPWVSTAATTMLGLLGAGAEDWGWAFQVGFVGSVAFGLAAFDLLGGARQVAGPGPAASHSPTWLPAPGRELAASCALLASLMCSTVGDAMVVGAAVLAFARFGWQRACRLLWPPVACYAVWFAGIGRLGVEAHSDHFALSTFTGLPGYVWHGLSRALGEATGLDALGPALLVGAAAWLAWQAQQLWANHPTLIAFCASALAFYALVGVGRDANGPPDASRYIYVAFALLLPVLAKILTGTQARPWPPARAAAVGLLLFLTLGNIGQAETWTSARTSLTQSLKRQLFAVGELVAAGVRDVSGPQAAPVPGEPNLQVANIAYLEREGLLARPHLGAQALSNAEAVLALGVWDGLNMTLSRSALFVPRLQFLGVRLGSLTSRHGACASFAPKAPSPPMSLDFRVPPGESGASIELFATAAASSGAVHNLAAFYVPVHGPASDVAVSLALPARGYGWLDDNEPGSLVVIDWAGPGSLRVCGLGK